MKASFPPSLSPALSCKEAAPGGGPGVSFHTRHDGAAGVGRTGTFDWWPARSTGKKTRILGHCESGSAGCVSAVVRCGIVCRSLLFPIYFSIFFYSLQCFTHVRWGPDLASLSLSLLTTIFYATARFGRVEPDTCLRKGRKVRPGWRTRFRPPFSHVAAALLLEGSPARQNTRFCSLSSPSLKSPFSRFALGRLLFCQTWLRFPVAPPFPPFCAGLVGPHRSGFAHRRSAENGLRSRMPSTLLASQPAQKLCLSTCVVDASPAVDPPWCFRRIPAPANEAQGHDRPRSNDRPGASV